MVFGHDGGGDGAGHGAGGAQPRARARRGRAVVARLPARAAQAPPPQPRVPSNIISVVRYKYFLLPEHTQQSVSIFSTHLKYLLKFAENMK